MRNLFNTVSGWAGGLLLAVAALPAHAFDLAYLRVPAGSDLPLYAGPTGEAAPGGAGRVGEVRVKVPPGTILRADADRIEDGMVFVWGGMAVNGWAVPEQLERVYPQELFHGIPLAGECWGREPAWRIAWQGTDATFEFPGALTGTGQLEDLPPPFDQAAPTFSIVLDETIGVLVLFDTSQPGRAGVVAGEVAAAGFAGVAVGAREPEPLVGACIAGDGAFLR